MTRVKIVENVKRVNLSGTQIWNTLYHSDFCKASKNKIILNIKNGPINGPENWPINEPKNGPKNDLKMDLKTNLNGPEKEPKDGLNTDLKLDL